jgi:hypothetical protein
MKGDRVEAVVDTGQGTRTFEIVATRAGRRLEVTSARGIVEVSEVTRNGTPVRTGRFMANRLIALVEHPALEAGTPGVEVSTSRRLGRAPAGGGRPLSRARTPAAIRPDPETAEAEDEDPADRRDEIERGEAAAEPPDPADRREPIAT